MDFSEGSALELFERLCSAYDVDTQKALAECLGVPAANVSNLVQRYSVPGSAFVKRALALVTTSAGLQAKKALQMQTQTFFQLNQKVRVFTMR